jgi:hypothetical protein
MLESFPAIVCNGLLSIARKSTEK